MSANTALSKFMGADASLGTGDIAGGVSSVGLTGKQLLLEPRLASLGAQNAGLAQPSLHAFEERVLTRPVAQSS